MLKKAIVCDWCGKQIGRASETCRPALATNEVGETEQHLFLGGYGMGSRGLVMVTRTARNPQDCRDRPLEDEVVSRTLDLPADWCSVKCMRASVAAVWPDLFDPALPPFESLEELRGLSKRRAPARLGAYEEPSGLTADEVNKHLEAR